MKLTETIVAITMFLACSRPCGAGERFVEAQEELARGRYEAAASLYRLEARECPTPEGLNNLGVCLERMGRFPEAAETYRRALALPGAGQAIQQNQRRAVIRSLLQTLLPYAAGFVALMVLLVTAKWLRRMLGGWRRRTFLDRVRLVEPACRLLLRDGSVRPDLFVTEDVCRITVSAGLAIPAAGAPEEALAILCEIRDPDGRVRKAFRASPGQVSQGRTGISFTFDDMAAMLGQPGTWAILIALGNTGRLLGRFELAVVTTSQLEADLELRDLRLMVWHDGRWQPTRNVLTDVEAFVPTGAIRPRTYPPHLYVGMQVTYGLTREGTGDTTDVMRVPMDFDNGWMSLRHAIVPVAGTAMAENPGVWRVRVCAGSRPLGDLRFTLLSPEAAGSAIVLRQFDLVAYGRSGRPIEIKSIVYLSQVGSVTPVLTLETDFPCNVPFGVSVGVFVNGEPAQEMEERVVFRDRVAQLMPGEFPLPPIEAGQNSYRYSLLVSAGGRCLGVREFEVRPSPVPGKDAQGRISRADRQEGIEYATEAAQIAGGAQVVEQRSA